MASLFVFGVKNYLFDEQRESVTRKLEEELADKGFDAEVLVLDPDIEFQAVIDDDDGELDGDDRIAAVSDDDLELLTEWLDLGLDTMGYTKEEISDEHFARYGELP